MRFLYFILTPLFYCLFLPSTNGQNQYLHDAQLLTTDDGLANLLTTSVYQDTKGFLWIGTQYGLNRYDGYEFKLFNKEKNGLSTNEAIGSIIEDSQGNLLLTSVSNQSYNLDIFNPKNETIIPFETYFETQPPFKKTDILPLKVIDNENRLWFLTNMGQLFLYENKRFKKIFENKNTRFRYLTVDTQSNIWIGGQNKLFKINLNSQILDSLDMPGFLSGIWTEENGTLWITTKPENHLRSQSHIWSKAKNSHHLKPFTLNHDNHNPKALFTPIRMKSGFWYVIINNHLQIFDAQGNSFKAFPDYFAKRLTNYFEGDEYVWFSTSLGLLKTSLRKRPFQLVHTDKTQFDYRGITEDENGNLYFLNGGLYQRNVANNHIRPLLEVKGVGFHLMSYNNSIWGGLYADDLLGFQFDLKTNEYLEYHAIAGINALGLIASKATGKFIVGQDKGLSYLDFNDRKVAPFTKYNGFDLLKKSKIYHLHKNESGIWLATSNGIFFMTEEDGILKHFDKTSGDLPFNDIFHIYEDEENAFWLATRGGGIIKWEKKDANSFSFQQITRDEGLSHNVTYAVYGDDYGYLWIPSDKGLMQMNKSTLQVKTFTTEDGIPHNEFNRTSHYQGKDGQLYFGGLGGLITFHPKDFANKSVNQTPLTFTGYRLLEEGAEKMTDKTDLLKTSNEIFIRPSDKLLELEFALLDYDDSENHHYAYKIEGYANNWNYIDENYLQITSLPYGNYNLKIKGKNGSDDWSQKELSLAIHVLKPFYLQWWFIALMVLLSIFIIRWRIRQLEKDKERLELEVKKRTQKIEEDKEIIAGQAKELRALDKVKTQFFSNITHEFRTPLTLVIGPIEQLLNSTLSEPNKKKLSTVLKNAKNLLGLINQLLDISKLESQQMKLEIAHGDIIGYTQELVKRFETLTNRKELNGKLISIKRNGIKF